MSKVKRRVTTATLTTGQIARICNVAPRTVQKWCDGGRLKYHRIPGSMDRRILRGDFLAFCRNNSLVAPELTPRLLVITPDPGLASSLGKLLEGTIDVRAAVNGFAAGLAAAEGRTRFVVIDLTLGRAESVAIARAVRPWRPDLVAAVANEDADPPASVTAAFDAVFRRPFDVADLAKRLKESL